jgi:CHAT domain-containing protein/tetratricopeptide (TPR) repeat protein
MRGFPEAFLLRLSRSPKRGPFCALVFILAWLGGARLSPATSPISNEERTGAKAGRELLEKGEYDQAVVYFSKALARGALKDSDKLDIYRRLAISCWYADKGREAIESSKRALEIAENLGMPELAAAIKGEIALQEHCMRASGLDGNGDPSGASREYEKAWQESLSGGGSEYQPRLLRIWSSRYLASPAAWQKFRDLNTKALEQALSLNYKLEASRAASNLGTFYRINNDFSHAMSFHFRALNYLGALKPSTQSIVCLNNIASVYMALGDYDRANDYLTNAMKILAADSSETIKPALLINLGQTLLSLGRRLQTPEYYNQALGCFVSYLNLKKRAGGKELDLHALNGMAAIYIDEGRLEEAKEVLLPALKAADANRNSVLSGMTLLNMAAISSKSGRISEATQYYNKAYSLAKQNDDYLEMVRAAYGLGRASEASGRSDLAVAFYNEAIRLIDDKGSNIVDDNDRAEFISRSREPYQALIELYYRLSGNGRLQAFQREIYRVAEGFRARSFLEQLQRQARRTEAGPSEAVRAEESRLQGERLNILKTLSGGAGRLTPAETDSLQSRIRLIDDVLDASVFETQPGSGDSEALAAPVSLRVLEETVLPERTALIEYFLGDERSFLMCVGKASFHLLELPPARTIEDSLLAYLSFLEDPALPAAKGLPAAERLYAELVSPAAGFIPAGVEHLVIVPDGILFRLPFETLVPDASAGASPSSCLNDRFVISYAPSASSLVYLKRNLKGPYAKKVLAFGVTDYIRRASRAGLDDIASASAVLNDLYRRNGFTIGPLPYARREITDLAKRLPPGEADTFFGADATEAAFKRLDLGAYRLIHLACHAFSDNRYPLRSSLVLTAGGDGEEDGFLQVSEMYRMRTRADLVVLSACQTGRGKIVKNEGILGLPRIFFYMGARSVISTLWPVHDKASAVFMDFFYDAYFRGAEKAEALREAKQRMAGTRYAHPYYWASYTLTGEF